MVDLSGFPSELSDARLVSLTRAFRAMVLNSLKTGCLELFLSSCAAEASVAVGLEQPP